MLLLGLAYLLTLSALFNPETSVVIQKRHPYTGNLNSETSGDSKYAFLHCGDVLATHHMKGSASNCCSVFLPAKVYAAGAGLRSFCIARFWMALRTTGTTTLPSGRMCQNGRSSYPYHLQLSKPDRLST